MNKIGLDEASFDTNDYNYISTLFEMFKQTFEESYNKLNSDNNTTIEIPEKLETELLEKVIEHYADHASSYNVRVSGVCPYKILSWSGYILADMVYTDEKRGKLFAIEAVSACMCCMLVLLEIEGVTIEEEFHKKALAMVMAEIRGSKKNKEDGNYSHTKLGLGMNGLYMMFRTAAVARLTK